ncbi:unnamed protein product [Paramecium octaurelia]|uniref:glutamate--tRNA ligase n=1 Tax=Paramecium octaurelia TaxID=43137 RepID=A0A8S1T1M9_PAROT|nr:unnamed protein product [Paramecium octaurelia]
MKQAKPQGQAQYDVLKGAIKGQVCTRFPPEPSGYLHIGHIKASVLNYRYSKMYEGKMLVRFDDTNPSKEKAEYQEAILEDLKTLQIEWANLSHSSDYFDLAEEKARFLIKKGLAYCDNTDKETMKKERFDGIESVNRNNSVEDNLEKFEQMLSGKTFDYCLRAKIDMKALNKCLRDPVLYRTNQIPHHRTGTKYKAYPTYDFVCPILDSIEGVTHAMRTNEYSDRIEQYQWVQQALELRPVEIYEFSRLNFVNTCLSKRKLQEFVDQKVVEGWQDPRFPTLRGIIRRGITVEALHDFMLEQGPSKNANLQTWDKLWSINFTKIDPIAPRYTAVGKDGIAILTISNYDDQGVNVVTVPQHPKNNELGTRPLFRSSQLYLEAQDAKDIKVDEKITLMKWGNVKITDKKEVDGQILLTGENLPDDKDFKTTNKYTWLAKDTPIVNVDLVEYDHLIKVKTIEEHHKFEDYYNTNSKYVTEAFADAGIKTLQVGSVLQFERRGFFRIDKIVGDKYELIYIPDGKTKAASIQTKLDLKSVQTGTVDEQKKEQQQQQQQEQPKQQKQQEQPNPESKKQQKKLEAEKKKAEKKAERQAAQQGEKKE